MVRKINMKFTENEKGAKGNGCISKTYQQNSCC